MKDNTNNTRQFHHVHKSKAWKLVVIVLSIVFIFTTSSTATVYDRESIPPLENLRDVSLLRLGYMNYPPIANDDSVSVYMDSEDNEIDVLADDIDPEGDPLTIINVTTPTNGTVTINGSMLYYTPEAGFVGLDIFSYTISDGHNGTDSADVRVNVEDMLSILMVGLISNVSFDYNFTSFKARFMLAIDFSTFMFTVYSSDELFVVSNLHFGLLKQKIIFGLFLVLPHTLT
jgi:hypothetical protein